MSYARSPRLVCSTTIGINMFGPSLALVRVCVVVVVPVAVLVVVTGDGRGFSLTQKPPDGLLAAHLRPQSDQLPGLVETLPQRRSRDPLGPREERQGLLEFLFAHFDLLLRGNGVEQQPG